MKHIKQQGHSKLNWQDLYYDGEIEHDEYFDEDTQMIYHTYDYWDFRINSDEKGYIEDASDDWYLDMLHGKIKRK